MQMRETGTGACSLPLNTECHLVGIKYRPEYSAINLILQFIGLTRSLYGLFIVYTESWGIVLLLVT